MYNGREILHFACLIVLESEILIRRAIRFDFPNFLGVLVDGDMMLNQFRPAYKVADSTTFSILSLHRTSPLFISQEPSYTYLKRPTSESSIGSTINAS